MFALCNRFQLEGQPILCEPYGNGHINTTYLVRTDASHDYILQKLNHHVFKDIPALMANVEAVTTHLRQKDSRPRRTLQLIPTQENKSFWVDEEGEYWRMYDFITDSLCLDTPESNEDFYQSAIAFGQFQNLLADFPAATLSETIARFHDTPNRFAALHAAIEADPLGRAAECQEEIAFALAREEDGAFLMNLLHEGKLPLRVTHNDTKLNNVMLDATTREALCVIDLDTVMPGLAANDFGDSIRFGANTGAEDETDLSKISLSLSRYEAYVRGFLKSCGDALTPLEIETLPWGAKLMTLECGIRFLADYLVGDQYFRIHREKHNLDRTRTQFKLVEDMERKWSEMEEIVRKAW